MMENLTFDQLPQAVAMLTNEISTLKNLLLDQKQPEVEQSERYLTVQEASEFLKLKVSTIYSKVSRGELPVMKGGKRLYFSSKELIEYLKRGRKKSHADIDAQANAYFENSKK